MDSRKERRTLGRCVGAIMRSLKDQERKCILRVPNQYYVLGAQHRDEGIGVVGRIDRIFTEQKDLDISKSYVMPLIIITFVAFSN